jgi:predicted dehydrogenase
MLSQHRLHFLEGEDSAQVLVRFEDGSVGAIMTSWAYDPPASTERFSVVGEDGSLWSDGSALHHQPRDGDVVTEQFAKAEPHTIALEVIDFIECLREGRRPINTEVEGIAVLKVILAAYASGDQRRIVALEDLR